MLGSSVTAQTCWKPDSYGGAGEMSWKSVVGFEHTSVVLKSEMKFFSTVVLFDKLRLRLVLKSLQSKKLNFKSFVFDGDLSSH